MRTAIIGAGFSGLVASAMLKKSGCEFKLFEASQRAGKKLLATGNGRCNITNENIDISRYHGNTAFAGRVLERFSSDMLYEFFNGLGLVLKTEEGKVYPHSLRASEVLDLLRLAEGECELCGKKVTKIVKRKNGLGVIADNKEEIFDNVLVATGGKAAPKLSGGGSYELLTSLGHRLTGLSPSIVQLKCDGTRALEGIKVNAKVTVGSLCDSGEVLFTSYGLSGPPVMQLSRDAKGKTLSLDLAPDMSFSEVFDYLKSKSAILYITAGNLFTGFINKKVGSAILKRVTDKKATEPASALSDKELKALSATVKNFDFLIKDTMGFDNAQVTAGGIDLADFDPETMESKLVKGLYAAGEVTDVDGDCGGFNLQWAFSSAYLAAQSIIGKCEL